MSKKLPSLLQPAVPLAASPAPLAKLPRTFYARGAEILAPDLLGKILVRRWTNEQGTTIQLRARLTEVEAYVGQHDLACHASKGCTDRTKIMFGPPGFAYVYLIYGMYDMLNIVCAQENDAQAVLIRGAIALDGFDADLSGPGKLARAMHITRKDNGADLTGNELYLLDDGTRPQPIARTPRIGVDYAGDWVHAPLRFIVQPEERSPSKPGKSRRKSAARQTPHPTKAAL